MTTTTLKSARRPAIALIITTVMLIVLSGCSLRGDVKEISASLERKTPLGSTEQEVIAYLDKKGIDYDEPWRGRVEAGTGYPPNTVPGSSFIEALVGEYWLGFVTSVTAFYIFGADRLLVEIVVRKSTDAF